MSDLLLSDAELVALTGYKWPSKQLAVLHARGFVRAYISNKGLVLERAHYEAVTKGEVATPRRGANLAHLRAA